MLALAGLPDLADEPFLPVPADDPALVPLDEESEPPVAEAGVALAFVDVEPVLPVADSAAAGAAVVSAAVDSATLADAALVAPRADPAVPRAFGAGVDRVTVLAAALEDAAADGGVAPMAWAMTSRSAIRLEIGPLARNPKLGS